MGIFCTAKDMPIVLYRGDDTDFIGNQSIRITIETELDISGCSVHFDLLGLRRVITELDEDKSFVLNFSRDDTKDFPIGEVFASLWLVDEASKRRTVADNIKFIITNNAQFAYHASEQFITLVMEGSIPNVKWSNVTDKPTTLSGYGITDAVKTVNGNAPDADGNVNVQVSSIPIATEDTLGGVKVGNGLSVTQDGTLSATHDDTKFDKTGGTMTGDLVVQADNASIRVVNTESPASPYTEIQDGKIVCGNENAQSAEIALPSASGVAALLENIAPDFADSASYAVGDLTVYGGALYRCTTAHQGSWAAADFAVCTVEDLLAALRSALAGKASVSDLAAKAAKSDIAPEFDAEDLYAPGQFVYHEGTLYYCVNEHEGAWNDLDFVDTQTISDILLEVKQLAETTDGTVAGILNDLLPLKLDGAFVADPYDATTGTYNVGDKVSYSGTIYRCTTAVTTPEPFDSDKWTEITLADYLAAKQDALSAAQLANIAAVPSKADAADLRYALVTKTIADDAVTLDDRAVNEVVVPEPDSEATEVTLTLNLPTAVSGKARDLLVRLDLTNVPTTGVDISGISFAPASGETPTYEVKGNAWPENEVGKVNLWSFTETKTAGKWAVGRETLTAVTQGSGS